MGGAGIWSFFSSKFDNKCDEDGFNAYKYMESTKSPRSNEDPCEIMYYFYKGCKPVDGYGHSHRKYFKDLLATHCDAVWDGVTLQVPEKHKAFRKRAEKQAASLGFKSPEDLERKQTGSTFCQPS